MTIRLGLKHVFLFPRFVTYVCIVYWFYLGSVLLCFYYYYYSEGRAGPTLSLGEKSRISRRDRDLPEVSATSLCSSVSQLLCAMREEETCCRAVVLAVNGRDQANYAAAFGSVEALVGEERGEELCATMLVALHENLNGLVEGGTEWEEEVCAHHTRPIQSISF